MEAGIEGTRTAALCTTISHLSQTFAKGLAKRFAVIFFIMFRPSEFVLLLFRHICEALLLTLIPTFSIAGFLLENMMGA